MSSTDKPSGAYLSTKPRSELRHWSTYASVSEWFQDYHGYVPIQMAAGLDRQMRGTGTSFPDAYRALLGIGAIIHIDPVDDLEPPPVEPRGTVTPREGAAKLTPEGHREGDRKAAQARCTRG
jgi:hypothetical protein